LGKELVKVLIHTDILAIFFCYGERIKNTTKCF
jgi:hypothetical protein